MVVLEPFQIKRPPPLQRQRKFGSGASGSGFSQVTIPAALYRRMLAGNTGRRYFPIRIDFDCLAVPAAVAPVEDPHFVGLGPQIALPPRRTAHKGCFSGGHDPPFVIMAHEYQFELLLRNKFPDVVFDTARNMGKHHDRSLRGERTQILLEKFPLHPDLFRLYRKLGHQSDEVYAAKVPRVPQRTEKFDIAVRSLALQSVMSAVDHAALGGKFFHAGSQSGEVLGGSCRRQVTDTDEKIGLMLPDDLRHFFDLSTPEGFLLRHVVLDVRPVNHGEVFGNGVLLPESETAPFSGPAPETSGMPESIRSDDTYPRHRRSG